LNKGPSHGYGLIGYPLTHSLSAKFFQEKFLKEKLADRHYTNFALENLSDFPALLDNNPDLSGLNVTIPYKEKIIPYLDELDPQAREIGAVNTVRITRMNGKTWSKGFNTDADGFLSSVDLSRFSQVFILGTGGASRAVGHAVRKSGIPFTFVSRNPRTRQMIDYSEFYAYPFNNPIMIINSTPLGMFPDIHTFPDIPYHRLTPDDFLYDLVYNPEQTLFLEKGYERGTKIQNGLKMLLIQADKSYEIWTNSEKQ
jgi:shikimate dehydrogenase